VYAGAVLALVALLLIGSWLLGVRHRERATGEAYESGIAPTGAAQGRFPAGYYLVAILFVIFDLEIVLFVAWALTARQAGWAGFGVIGAVALTLTAAWAYLWRVGALEWWKPPRVGGGRRTLGGKEEERAVQAPPLNQQRIPRDVLPPMEGTLPEPRGGQTDG
ncbi:MAG: NADH-quinone oxidoreductase subunit A, partial [Planctomycetota bacterium]|nr:NADH-quinone oxidoreductase subunit A [Planctomycetota bacterium]